MENDEHMLYTWFLISFKPKKKWEKKKNVTCPVPFLDDPGFIVGIVGICGYPVGICMYPGGYLWVFCVYPLCIRVWTPSRAS